MKVRAERLSADDYALIRGEKVVAHTLLLTSGRWGLFDTDGRRIVTATFEKPAAAARALALLPSLRPGEPAASAPEPVP